MFKKFPEGFRRAGKALQELLETKKVNNLTDLEKRTNRMTRRIIAHVEHLPNSLKTTTIASLRKKTFPFGELRNSEINFANIISDNLQDLYDMCEAYSKNEQHYQWLRVKTWFEELKEKEADTPVSELPQLLTEFTNKIKGIFEYIRNAG